MNTALVVAVLAAIPGLGSLLWQVITSARATEHKRDRLSEQLRREEDAMASYLEALLLSFERFTRITMEYHYALYLGEDEWTKQHGQDFSAEMLAINHDARAVTLAGASLPLSLRDVASQISTALQETQDIVIVLGRTIHRAFREKELAIRSSTTTQQAQAQWDAAYDQLDKERAELMNRVDELRKWIETTWLDARRDYRIAAYDDLGVSHTPMPAPEVPPPSHEVPTRPAGELSAPLSHELLVTPDELRQAARATKKQ